MTETRKIILTGTHLTPAVELINQLKTDKEIDWEIYYLGRLHNSATSKEPSIESIAIPKIKVKFYGLNSGKFDRRWLPNTLRGLPQIYSGYKQAYSLLKKIKPHLVVSFGGYVSVPVIIAAWRQKIVSLTHEQTSTLSLATRINALFCRYIALSFPLKTTSDKYLVTGNLLRREIFNSDSLEFKKNKYNLKKFPLIFLTAGNQGSHHLNLVLKDLLPKLSSKYTIIHQSGQKDYPFFNKLSSKYPNYIVKDYVNSPDIGWVFNHCQVIISRAGANTIQEIEALKLPAIVIPLPVSQQNEQLKNAFWLQKKSPKKTIVIKDADITADKLETVIDFLASIKRIPLLKSASPNLRLLKLIKRL